MSLDPHVSMNTMPKEYRRLFLEAEGAFASGDYETARNLYQSLADKYADYVDGWFGLTKCHLLLENYIKFGSCYTITKDVAADFDPFPSISNIIRKNPHLTLKLVAALADQEAYEESLRYINYYMVLTKGEDQDSTILNLKNIITERLEKKREEKKRAELRKKKAENMRWIITGIILGVLLITSFMNLFKFMKQSSAKSHFIKGQNYYQIARDEYRKYMKYGQGFVDMQTNMEMAKVEFDRALEVNPNYNLPHLMLGKIYLLQRDVEFIKIRRNLGFDKEKFDNLLREAEKETQKAIECDPAYPDSYLEMAKVQYEHIRKKGTIDNSNLAIEKAEKYYAADNEKKEEIIREANKLLKLAEKLR